MNWKARTSRLQAYNAKQKGAILQRFCEIFEILEHPFSSYDFKKIICGRVFNSVVGVRQDSYNRNKIKLQHICFSSFFLKVFGAVILKNIHEISFYEV